MKRFAIILLLALFTSCCGDSHQTSMRIWEEFDQSVMKAAGARGNAESFKWRADYSKIKNESNAAYAQAYTAAVKRRNEQLTSYGLSTSDRPEPNESDMRAIRAAMQEQETALLIRVGLSYNAETRAKKGDELYYWYKQVRSPLALILSERGVKRVEEKDTIPNHILITGDPFFFEKEYHPLLKYDGPAFLLQLEKLHATDRFWDKDGLSDDGVTYVRWMCAVHDLDVKVIFLALNAAR